MTNDPLKDIMDQASIIAKAIVKSQKDRRSEPYVNVLKEIGSRYATADPNARIGLNQEANQAREAYTSSGGSPMDLDRSLWGSDPSKGFQTGQGQFKPGYAGDNLTIGQKIAMSPIFGTYEGKPTFDRQVREADLTGMFGGKMTLPAMTQGLQNQVSMGNLGETRRYHDILTNQQGLDNLYKLWDTTGKAPAGIPGVTPGTSLYDKVAERKNNYQAAIEYAIKDPNYQDAPADETIKQQQILAADTEEDKQRIRNAPTQQDIINQYFNILEKQSASGGQQTAPTADSQQVVSELIKKAFPSANTGMGPYYTGASAIMNNISDDDIFNMTKK